MRAPERGVEYIAGWTAHYNGGDLGGFYIRPHGPVVEGYIHSGHAHYIDHLMFVEAGSVRVDWRAPDGETGFVVIDSPNFWPVKMEFWHQIKALKNGTRWRCLFAAAEMEKYLDRFDAAQIPHFSSEVP